MRGSTESVSCYLSCYFFITASLARFPALRLELASNGSYLSQLMAMAHSPTYNSSAIVVQLNSLRRLARWWVSDTFIRGTTVQEFITGLFIGV